MDTNRSRWWIALCVLGSAGLWPGHALGQAQEGITVVGTGTVQVKPNAIEITGVVSGEAELAGDALVKYRDNKRRAVAAIEALKIDGVAAEGTGFAINSTSLANAYQQVVFGGQQPQTTAPKITVSEPLLVTIKNIESLNEEEIVKRIIRVIDAGKDAGLNISGGPTDRNSQILRMQMGIPSEQGLATFKLIGAGEARKRAYEEAMKSAKANAQRLAELAGVKLGKVASVTEQNNPNANRQVVYMYNLGGDSESNEPTYQSGSFKNIPVNVILAVRFEIQP